MKPKQKGWSTIALLMPDGEARTIKKVARPRQGKQNLRTFKLTKLK